MVTKQRVDKTEILAELDRIAADNDGVLLPEHVVSAAEDPDSILHDRFEWDDRKAAFQHRVEQARSLITWVEYRYVRQDRVIESVAYISNPRMSQSVSGYIAVSSIKDEDTKERALQVELDRILSLIVRARGIAMAINCVEKFDAMIAEAICKT